MSSRMAMPIVVVCLGGEMIYVLHQRLVAQSIEPKKAQQVLDEVLTAMFSPAFLDELFRPHVLYTYEATKQIFTRLAHCSIMKLNEVSMSKLYDLMTMGFKHQLLACRSPCDILKVVVRHVATLKELVSEQVDASLEACRVRIKATYGSFTIGQFWTLKQTLLDFVHGRNVKISLLLQENYQGQDGRMILSMDGPCPPETPVPGKVRHFDAEASIQNEYQVDLCVFKTASPEEYSPAAYTKAHEHLGANLYALKRGGPASRIVPTPAESKLEEERVNEEKRKEATEELSRLAQLIQPKSTSDSKSFKFHLDGLANDCFDFGDSGWDASMSKEQDASDSDLTSSHTRCINLDGKADRKTLNSRMKDLELLGESVECGASKEPDGDEDDYLDLMDMAIAEGSHK